MRREGTRRRFGLAGKAALIVGALMLAAVPVIAKTVIPVVHWVTFVGTADSSVAVAKDVVFVSSTGAAVDDGVYALSAETGEVFWGTVVGVNPSSIVADKGLVAVATDDGVWTLESSTGIVRWVTFVGSSQSSIAFLDDVLYVTTDSGVTILDRATGEILAVIAVGEVDSNLVVAKSTVYVTSDIGLIRLAK